MINTTLTLRQALLCLLTAGCFPISAPVLADSSCVGVWAAQARPPYGGDDLMPIIVWAPDRSIYITVDRNGLIIVSKSGQISRVDVPINPPLVEVKWSPDSRHLFINASDGGIVGSWNVKVYSVDARGLIKELDVGDSVRKSIKDFPQCEEREFANIAAVAWLANGNELLLVAEVPPHSTCSNMGSVRGFRMSSTTGEILEQVSERMLKRRWGAFLGCRLAHLP